MPIISVREAAAFVLPPPPVVSPSEPEALLYGRLSAATHSLCLIITTLFVLARTFTKMFVIRRMVAEDYITLVAWTGSLAFNIIALLDLRDRMGLVIWGVDFRDIHGYLLQILYGPTTFGIKLAILLLYRRVFGLTRAFLITVYALIGILAAYTIAITGLKIFICDPIEIFWNPALLAVGSCIDTHVLQIPDCIIPPVSDLVILLMPLPVIWKLNVSTRRKVGVSLIFTAGLVACVTCFLRLYVTVTTENSYEQPYSNTIIVFLASAEIAVGIICACLPVIPALVRYIKTGGQSPTQTPTPYYDMSARTDSTRRQTVTNNSKTGDSEIGLRSMLADSASGRS